MAKIEIDVSKCKGCFLCIKYCPKGCFRVSDSTGPFGVKVVEAVNTEECSLCKNCELICPESCIKVKKK